MIQFIFIIFLLQPVGIKPLIILISEIENIEIVKITDEERKTKVYYKHWFNKYLLINLKNGDSKYVYVGNYSNNQIKKIIKLMMKKVNKN